MAANLHPVWLITRREVRDQFRDWRIMLPLAGFTLLFPALMILAVVSALGFAASYDAGLIVERFVPLFLLTTGFLPITISLIVSLEAFVGEKERGTIEPLLSAPLADWQLYIGKMLAGLFFPLISSYTGVAIYLLAIGWLGIPWPDASALIQALILTAAHAAVMVNGAIVVSTQSTSVRAANLLATFIILPVALLIEGESLLMFWGNIDVLWLALPLVVLLTGMLMRLGLSHFQREYLLSREIDTFSPRWLWGVFRNAFTGGVRSLAGWYRQELRATLGRMRAALWITILLGLGTLVGAYFAAQVILPALVAQIGPEQIDAFRGEMGNALAGGDVLSISVVYLFGHNLQALLVSFLVGAFSLGVGSTITYIINFTLIGGVLSGFALIGQSPWLLLVYGILPHGVFEIPALVLASAAVLRMGAALITPDRSRTMTESFLVLLADYARVMVGLVIPLLLLAAVIETYVTPLLLAGALGG